jgi:hypothetical protein
MRDFMNALYFHQQYSSHCFSMTVTQVFQEFVNLKTNAALYMYLKEHTRTRNVGLGWEEAYHPSSKGGYIYTPIELLEHLTEVVIPL